MGRGLSRIARNDKRCLYDPVSLAGGYVVPGPKCRRCGDVCGDVCGEDGGDGAGLCGGCLAIMPHALRSPGMTPERFVAGDELGDVDGYVSIGLAAQAMRASVHVLDEWNDDRKAIRRDAGGWARMMGWDSGR